jgi:hypothetical protein
VDLSVAAGLNALDHMVDGSGLTASIGLAATGFAATGFAVVEHERAPTDAPSAPLAGLHQLSSAVAALGFRVNAENDAAARAELSCERVGAKQPARRSLPNTIVEGDPGRRMPMHRLGRIAQNPERIVFIRPASLVPPTHTSLS